MHRRHDHRPVLPHCRHCVSDVGDGPIVDGGFNRSPLGNGQEVTEGIALAETFFDGVYTDLAIGKLNRGLGWTLPNGKNLNPASIGYFKPPSSMQVTAYGFGKHNPCFSTNPHVDGHRRYKQYNYRGKDSSEPFVCPGDSGGPHFLGWFTDPPQGQDVFYLSSSKRHLWRVKEYLLAKMRKHTWNGLEVGIDRWGMDYASLEVEDGSACEFACGRDGACKAFTYVSPWRRCFLKQGLPDATPCQDFVSGVPQFLNVHIDLPGSDLYSFTAPSFDACEAVCGRDVACDAYTFSLQDGGCWIKAWQPSPVMKIGFVSGWRRGFESRTQRPGGNYKSLTFNDDSSCADACMREARCRAWSFEDSRLLLAKGVHYAPRVPQCCHLWHPGRSRV